MASWYSVIQYVPDPLADERINIGVVVFDDGNVHVQFLKRWERVRCFGMEDISFLRSFARRMKDAAALGELLPADGEQNSAWETLTYLERTQKATRVEVAAARGDLLPGNSEQNTEETLIYLKQMQRAARGWINSIQFTEPRKSLDSVQGQLEDAVQTYLKEPPVRERRKLRDRQEAARLAISQVRGVLKKQLGQRAVKELLRPQYLLAGRREEHQVDVAVANGQAYLVAHAISFEVQVTRQNIDSVFWMVSDVREAKPELPIAVVALKPVEGTFGYKEHQALYSRTIKVYEGLGASVLGEADIKTWTRDRIHEMRF